MDFSKLICHFLLICFQVLMSKISAKSDKFFLTYSNLFRGLHFIRTECIYMHIYTVSQKNAHIFIF